MANRWLLAISSQLKGKGGSSRNVGQVVGTNELFALFVYISSRSRWSDCKGSLNIKRLGGSPHIEIGSVAWQIHGIILCVPLNLEVVSVILKAGRVWWAKPNSEEVFIVSSAWAWIIQINRSIHTTRSGSTRDKLFGRDTVSGCSGDSPARRGSGYPVGSLIRNRSFVIALNVGGNK